MLWKNFVLALGETCATSGEIFFTLKSRNQKFTPLQKGGLLQPFSTLQNVLPSLQKYLCTPTGCEKFCVNFCVLQKPFNHLQLLFAPPVLVTVTKKW